MSSVPETADHGRHTRHKQRAGYPGTYSLRHLLMHPFLYSICIMHWVYAKDNVLNFRIEGESESVAVF